MVVENDERLVVHVATAEPAPWAHPACGAFASVREGLARHSASAPGLRRTTGRSPRTRVALVLPGVGLRAPAAQPEVRAQRPLRCASCCGATPRTLPASRTPSWSPS